MGAGGITASTYGRNPDGTPRTAQDVIADRNDKYSGPYDPSQPLFNPTRGIGANGLPGSVNSGVTQQQYYNFMQNYLAQNPQASDEDVRVAGYRAGIYDTPSGMGGWDMLVTQVLPIALSLASLPAGVAGGGSALGSLGRGIGSILGGGTPTASGAASAIPAAAGGTTAAGGAASAIPAAAGDIVVTAPATAGIGATGLATLGGGAVGQAINASHSADGSSASTPAHNVAPTSTVGPDDIVVTGPRAPTGGSVIPPTVAPGDWVVTGNRPPMPDAPIPPNVAVHTADGTSSSPQMGTPTPSGPPPTSFPWKQLLKMIPGSAQRRNQRPAPASSPTMANKTGASPFGGGTGAGASINIQGANRPSIYPWVSPGVTSSGQVRPQDQDGGYYG